MNENTLFLRLEGALQAWGSHEGKFVIRRSAEAPTKSGVIGLLCAALGVSRKAARDDGWLDKLGALKMGVRIDRPGVRWWDWHTVGAKMKMRIAGGGEKDGALLSRREYLCDASFLVALQGDPELIADLKHALENPVWTLYLGRKCCPPSRPLLEREAVGDHPDLITAFKSVPWRQRYSSDQRPKALDCLLDWMPTAGQPEAREDAEIWYDVPFSFDPPAHHARFVVRSSLKVKADGGVERGEPLQTKTKTPLRPRANYTNTAYKEIRAKRLEFDHHLCVFCKNPATTVQHVTYRHAGGDERLDELRSLCRLCHDAVTTIEYGLGMGLDRINPEDPGWRDKIIQKREEIIRSRSQEKRKRLFNRQGMKLEEEEVE